MAQKEILKKEGADGIDYTLYPYTVFSAVLGDDGNGSLLSRIKYDTDGTRITSIPLVIGTLTAATSSGTWTGSLKNTGITSLYDGLTIKYYLPYSSSGNVTLNLTLDDDTTTGTVNCYYGNNTRLTTHYSQGSVILFTYFSAGSIKVLGTTTTDNRWIALSNYDSNNDTYWQYSLHYDYSQIDIGGNLGRYSLCMRTASGGILSLTTTNNSLATTKTFTTTPLLISDIYYYASTTDKAVSTSVLYITNNNALFESKGNVIDFRYSSNCGTTLTAKKPVYLYGTPSGAYFTLEGYTQALPTSEDGKIYILVGTATSTYQTILEMNNPAYWYKDGALRLYTGGDYLDKSGGTVDGSVTFNSRITGNISGNAATADRLSTYRSFTIGSATKSFDGSANVSFSSSELGCLPLAGGTMNSAAVITSTDGNGIYKSEVSGQTIDIYNTSTSNRTEITASDVKIGVGTTSFTEDCSIQYDSTNKCLKFVFS